MKIKSLNGGGFGRLALMFNPCKGLWRLVEFVDERLHTGDSYIKIRSPDYESVTRKLQER